jgi:hypothetical protein
MKKQIITIASVALAALILFTTYAIFFQDDGIEEIGDPFYTLTDEVKTALSEINTDVTVALKGYDSDDDGWEMIYRFATAMEEVNDSISVETAGGNKTVQISANGQSKELAYDGFFKTLYNGVRYGFDGEALMVNAILSLCGKEEKAISLRAFEGYDVDGDEVTSSGAPFIFTALSRSQISFLSITNSHGKYSIYKDGNEFYFGSSRAVSYNDEMFSQVTTDCRYPVAVGKMDKPEGKDWKSYGLDIEKPATASYTIMSETDSTNKYFLHSVYIGSLSSTGNYYYARYVGAQFEPTGKEGESDKMVHNLSKDKIYFIAKDTVDASIGLPETDIMKPMLVNPISNSEQVLSIDDIRIDLYGDGVSAIALRQSDFNPASNLAAIDTSALSKVISDKVSATDYSSYEGGWIKHIDVFGAFTSSDGKSTYIEAALARQCKNGEYKINLGLLRDEANGAYLPEKLTFSKSYDGNNWHEIENGEVSVGHSDGTVKKYEFSFTDETNVKYIRIGFDVPQKQNSYVIFDEIRIYADGVDAQPSSAIGGTWKLTAPTEYIPEGRNYHYLDMSNFNNFVQSMAVLTGDRVVACGFSKDGDASTIDKEKLAKFGLDTPDKHFSFEFQGVVTDIYVSKPNENGGYYLYSTFTGEVEGETVNATPDVIVEVTKETAPFLAWDIVEYLDHSLVSIYIVDISKMEIAADGKNHVFDLSLDAEGGLGDVKYQGKSYDVKSFKYLYQSIISIYLQDAYVPNENETSEEYLRVKIHTETNSPEIVFYRVSSSRCYFTVDGQGGYYCLVEDVKEARDRLFQYINGEILTK